MIAVVEGRILAWTVDGEFFKADLLADGARAKEVVQLTGGEDVAKMFGGLSEYDQVIVRGDVRASKGFGGKFTGAVYVSVQDVKRVQVPTSVTPAPEPPPAKKAS